MQWGQVVWVISHCKYFGFYSKKEGETLGASKQIKTVYNLQTDGDSLNGLFYCNK